MNRVVRVHPSEAGWLVDVAGHVSVFRTQAEAEEVGRNVARTDEVEFLLYDARGLVRERVSYGGDTSHLPATEL